MPDGQVQAPIETPQVKPATTEPVWHLLFDRLDAQDENIKRAVDNTVVIATEQERLRLHVNHEQEEYTRLLRSKVDKGSVLVDLWDNFKTHRPAQLVTLAIVTAMAPVVVYNWGALVENLRSVF